MFDIESLKEMVSTAFGDFSNDLNDITIMILQKPENFNSGAWTLIKSIFDAMLPIGYSFVALFFIIDFLNKCLMFEWMRWENVVKCLLKLVVAKLIIENSFMLLTTMFSVVTNIINKAHAAYDPVQMKGANIDAVLASIDGMGFWDRVGFYMSVQPWVLVMNGIKLAIYVVVYGRMVELYLMTAISPLPLSTLVGEGTHDIAKRFLKTYFALCLQGVVLLIGCMLYSSMITGLAIDNSGEWGSIMKIMLVSIILLSIFVKSGSWSKQLTGVY